MNDPNTNTNTDDRDCVIQLDAEGMTAGTPEDQARAEESARRYEASLAEEARQAAQTKESDK